MAARRSSIAASRLSPWPLAYASGLSAACSGPHAGLVLLHGEGNLDLVLQLRLLVAACCRDRRIAPRQSRGLGDLRGRRVYLVKPARSASVSERNQTSGLVRP